MSEIQQEVNGVVFADGTAVNGAYISRGNGNIFIYMPDMTMLEACELLTNPNSTSTIAYGTETYEGYTDLFILQKGTNQIGAGLARP